MSTKPSTVIVLALMLTAVPAAWATSNTTFDTEFDAAVIPAAATQEPTGTQSMQAADLSRELELVSTKGIGGVTPFVIPAAAFSAKDVGSSAFFKTFSGYMQGSSMGGCVQAPVYLPQGAEIVEMWASLYDNDPGVDIYVTLIRTEHGGYHSSDDLATLHTSGDADGMQTPADETIDYPKVQYFDYSYSVHLCLPSVQTRLYSVRIYYEIQIFSDDFESGDTSQWSSASL